MDFLKAEIERKRKAQQPLEASLKSGDNSSDGAAGSPPPAKKFVRRGEIEKERERKYLEDQDAKRKVKEDNAPDETPRNNALAAAAATASKKKEEDEVRYVFGVSMSLF